MDENARKRKRELEGEGEGEGDDSSSIDLDIEKEKPLEGLKPPSNKQKKQKTEKDSGPQANREEPTADDSGIQDAKAKARADKRKQKAEKKKEKLVQKQQKQESKKALQKEFSSALGITGEAEVDEELEDEEDEPSLEEHDDERIEALDVSGLIEEPAATATSSSADSNASSAESVTSSSTSIIPPATKEVASKKGDNKKEHKPFELDPKKHDAFKARLAAKLEALRTARKADGPDGRPARNRAELIEARRKKEAERKAAKKANRQLAKEDEERLKAEEQLARLRGGSGSPMLFSTRGTPEDDRNLAFGRVAWKDGQQLDSNLSGFLDSKKKKGRSDPKTALEAAKKKQARINALDEEKRKDIQEKDLWLSAKKRAQGEKVHDDATLLKKSLKRQEKQKAKSKQEWKDRLTNVQKGQAMKQKKREENLKKRREEKGSKGKGKGKGKKVNKPGKKVKRPGFEGTFKAR